MKKLPIHTEKLQSAVQLSIVIPTYGRAESLGALVGKIQSQIEKDFPKKSFEIILVNDESPDQTSEVLAKLETEFESVLALNLSENQGQQAATLIGLRTAKGSMIVTMDDDGKDDPADIHRLVEMLSKGHDVVYGVPRIESLEGCNRDCLGRWEDVSQNSKIPALHRRIGTQSKEWLLRAFCKKPVGIRLTSFRAMTRETVDRVIADKRRHVYISATILQQPVRIGQVPVAAPIRNHSGYSWIRLLKLFMQIVIWYGPFYRPETQS